MEIADYLRHIWKYKWVIFIVTLLTGFMVTIRSLFLPNTYDAFALTRVYSTPVGDGYWRDYNLTYSDRIKNTYVTLVQSAPVQAELLQRLNLSELPEISVEIIPESELVQFSARSDDPEIAASVANEMATLFTEEAWRPQNEILTSDVENMDPLVAELEAERLELSQSLEAALRDGKETAVIEQILDDAAFVDSQIKSIRERQLTVTLTDQMHATPITIVELAPVPSDPSGPNRLFFNLAGLAAGLIGGILIAFLLKPLEPLFQNLFKRKPNVSVQTRQTKS